MENTTNNPFTLKAKGKLIDLQRPIVMGILNVTPDSFFAGSRSQYEQEITDRATRLVDEGATIIDVGGYSSRPGAEYVSANEETERLAKALGVITKKFPTVPLSVDTFRSDVARTVVEHFGVDIINDISGGLADDKMFKTVASLNVGYVLMHMAGNPQTMQQNPTYNDVVKEVSLFLSQQMAQLAWAGVTDVVVDPGFGFGKTIDHNYQLLARLDEFKLLNAPIMVGLSRKSMVYKTLQNTPEEALNGTSVLNTLALTKGANILRVHDVKEAMECILLTEKTQLMSHGIS